MTDQLTIHSAGMVGRAYRRSPFPFGETTEHTLVITTQVPINVVLTEELVYALKLQTSFNPRC